LSTRSIDLDASVRSKFTVKDSFQLEDGEMEFSVAYGPDSKEKFVELFRELAESGFIPRLVGTEEEALLFVRKTQTVERRRSRVPVIFALLALGSVVAFGLFLAMIYHQYAPSFPEVTVIFVYGAAVIAIVAAHELGHMYVSHRKGEAAPAPYVLPGIPGVTAALPALGIISRQRAPAVNRDRFFDIILAGPLLGLLATLVLYLLGASLTVQSAVPLQSCQQVNGTATLCPSVVQMGLNAAIGPLLPSITPGYSALSPLADGATVGLILTFVGLLPMASFDGGQLTSLAWGPNASRVASYLSVFLLLFVDLPTYWALAVVVLLLMSFNRFSELQLLDEVSPISNTRRWIYLGALALALLCMPLPQTFAGLHLG
jgi:hypothetical protein